MIEFPAPQDTIAFAEPVDRTPFVDSTNHRQWRNWLHALLLVSLSGGTMLYLAVVLIDPFSTGRFSLTQRLDITTSNERIADAVRVRDLRFDGGIFGDSTGVNLDPSGVAGESGWRIVQLAIAGARLADILTMARAFERHHAGSRTLEVFVLDMRWCANDAVALGTGSFPDWLYESTDEAYLSRILSSDAVATAALRVRIWLGLAKQAGSADGYSPIAFERRLPLLLLPRPTNGLPPDVQMPEVDALAEYMSTLPADFAVAFVLAPPYVSALPNAGSAAAARLQICKDRVRQIAAGRANTAYLDLMMENSITRSIEFYQDPLHYNLSGAREIERRIARLIEESGLSPK